MSANENNLIWIDLEMTGLDPERDRIIEIATLVTDANLNILAEGPTIAVHQSDEQLALMDDWNVRTHTASGLVERVKASTMGDREAELATLEFLKQWVPAGKSPICGNSIGQDRRFLFKYMPELEAYFHYRYLDVSTLKELARRWKPEITLTPRLNNNARKPTSGRNTSRNHLFSGLRHRQLSGVENEKAQHQHADQTGPTRRQHGRNAGTAIDPRFEQHWHNQPQPGDTKPEPPRPETAT